MYQPDPALELAACGVETSVAPAEFRSPFDLTASEFRDLMQVVTGTLADYLDRLPNMPVSLPGDIAHFLADPSARRAPADEGRPLAELLEIVARAADVGVNPAARGHMAYIPSAGLSVSAVADLISGVLNRYTGVSAAAPAFVALELDVIGWLTALMDLPATAGGILTSGGSLAAFSALLCARAAHPEADFNSGALYLTNQTHHSLAKAARLAGFSDQALRIVPVDASLRMDLEALEIMIKADRKAGLTPFCIVGSAGATNTGTVDPLHGIADIAEAEQVWFHVDAAYGGFFRLTQRGLRRLDGIERADSIVLDPHKGLFLPFGTGCLLVRDAGWLSRAHAGVEASYLRDVEETGLADFSDISPELTRPYRGLRLWLSLHLYGVAAFRAALDGMLDLVEDLHRALCGVHGIELLGQPDLTVVAFRCIRHPRDGADEDLATEELIRRVNAQARFYLSSTRIDGRIVARIVILNYRTRRSDIRELVELIRNIAADLADHSSGPMTGADGST